MGGGCGRNGVVVGWNGAAEGGDWQSGPAAGRVRGSDGYPDFQLSHCLTVPVCAPPLGGKQSSDLTGCEPLVEW